jgi:hypothetical protein
MNEDKAMAGLEKARIADVHRRVYHVFNIIMIARDSAARIERRCILVAGSRVGNARTAGRDGAIRIG